MPGRCRSNHESVISQQASRRYLQRPDLHFPPLDGTSGVLKRKRPFGELAVPDVDGDDPVENDGQFRSAGLDLQGVLLAAGFIADGDRYLLEGVSRKKSRAREALLFEDFVMML